MMCAMKFRQTLSYDHPPGAVFAMLADPAFREQVCVAQDVVSHDVRLTATAAGFELVMEQVQNTAGLPAIAKKITGDTTRAVVTESWSDPSGGTMTIEAPGKPTKASGTIALTAAGSGTEELVELDVKVKVPLIGGKLEQLMVDTIRAGYEIEQNVGTAWLAGDR